jgi:putative peptide zinc metalloprotease protein
MSATFLSSSWHRVAKLKPRPRGHVAVRRHSYRGRPWYVIKDEISGRIHRFTPAVYLFVGLMDGKRTVDELWSTLVNRLEDGAPTQDEIIHLLAQLHAADLLQPDVTPDAAEMLERHASYSKVQFRRSFGSMLSIKVPLLDPDRFLGRAVRLVRPLLGWSGALLWLAVTLPAVILAAISWPELTGDIADQVLTPENMLIVALTFPVLKTLHELGHGYATKAWGGAVHELGFMLLVFAPVPYVDASAAAAFPSKWRRALVGGAGMLVELFVASIALYIWLLVEPGVIRSVCYNIMLIAGISTVIFNGNPLLRFDGYYILCDLIEIPNLGMRSVRYWQWLADRWIFGAKVELPDPSRGEQAWFLLYAPLAFAYRLSVIIGIALFLAQHYFIVGVTIALWAVFSGIGRPLLKAIAHVTTSSRLAEKRCRAIAITFGTCMLGAAGLLAVPMPHHTTAEGVIWLPEDHLVRATADGFVVRLVTPSRSDVGPGALLVEMEEPEAAFAVRIFRSQSEAAEIRFRAVQFANRVDAKLALEELGVLREGLVQAEKNVADLWVRSPAPGVFVVPQAGDLPGRFLHRGTVIGYIEEPRSRLLRVVVTQGNIDLVRDHLKKIEVKFPQQPKQTWPAHILREIPAGAEELPSMALAGMGGGQFAIDPRYPEQLRSFERTFQFELELPPGAGPGYFGSRVYVRFTHDAEPLGLQWYRRLRQLFLSRFDA